MKRIAAILSIALIVCALFSACSSDGDKASGVSLKDVYQQIKTEVTLPDTVELDSAKKLDRSYGITEDMVADYAGGIDSSGVTMTEIVLIRAKDENSAAEIGEKLNKRLQSKLNQNRNYNPEQAEIIEKCKVETDGLYVTLVISQDADKINAIIRQHIK